ncbi:MAG: T9SS type A sorting domain-containing protein [Candidatus Eisenbacteria bacterium]|uniref:T9SS type A sorting domain-containing protein n=1 Tax=Eiseniibacteriota bacterium TaxID=2212470 RepID=A0A933SGF1_UNCEI|nr:T9SS type A sorting domain-containing protein [Candidatus Eisenbacteria bacterium]
MSHPRFLLLLVALVLAPDAARAAVDVPVGIFGTFLRVDPIDTAAPPTMIRLSTYGIAPGALLRLQARGDYDNGPGGDEFTIQLAIFSKDSALADRSLLARVPGAIDCGRHGQSGLTCPSGLPTDIPQDFYVMPDSTDVIVPPGARFLFVMPAECYFVDNTDPDGDYAIRITTLGMTDVEDFPERPLALSAPWPNPVSKAARFSFRLAESSNAAVHVFAVDGARVRALHDGPAEAGEHALTWDLRDETGSRVKPGVYFVRLESRDHTLRRRLVVVR